MSGIVIIIAVYVILHIYFNFPGKCAAAHKNSKSKQFG